MYFPSGDHKGVALNRVSSEMRVALAVSISTTQRSRWPLLMSCFITSTRLPSGEKAGWEYSAGSPTFLTTCPLRSKIVICWSSWPRGGGLTRKRAPSALMYMRSDGTGTASRNSNLVFLNEKDGDVLISAVITEW